MKIPVLLRLLPQNEILFQQEAQIEIFSDSHWKIILSSPEETLSWTFDGPDACLKNESQLDSEIFLNPRNPRVLVDSQYGLMEAPVEAYDIRRENGVLTVSYTLGGSDFIFELSAQPETEQQEEAWQNLIAR